MWVYSSVLNQQAVDEVLAHEQNHRSRDCLNGRIACRAFQIPALGSAGDGELC
jgi:hypothetical protein